MSYVNMDHAGWVENNVTIRKSYGKKPKRDRHGHIVGNHAAPDKLTEFQAKVMNILGIVGGGIYNAPITWETVDWQHGHGLSLVWGNGLATFDFGGLTRLVFLCHDARIRVSIDPAGPRHLRLSFFPRSHEGSGTARHPNLAEAVAAHRASVPLDHSIAYRMPVVAETLAA